MININWTIVFVSTAIIELITLFLRFKVHKKSPTFFRSIKKKLKLPFIIRVHHFFTGLLIMIIAYFIRDGIIFSLGLGISLSDILHHTILKIETGKSEFTISEKDTLIR